MKNKLFALLVLLVGFLASCDNDENIQPQNPNNETSENAVRRFQQINSLADRARGMGSGVVPLPGLGRVDLGRSENGRFSMARTEGDSTECDWDDIEFETCAEVTETEGDGTYTIEIDYGVDGCEEDGYLIKGKITEIYTESENEETIKIIYEGFEFDSIRIDGTSTAAYSFSFDENDSSEYSYSVSWTEDIVITDADGATFTVKAEWNEVANEEGFTETGSFTATGSNGDVYSSTIVEPIVYKFACEEDDVFVPVSGIEECNYNGEIFKIDYGNGECDNKAIVTENGESFEIDFSEEWDDDWDEDDDSDGDNG